MPTPRILLTLSILSTSATTAELLAQNSGEAAAPAAQKQDARPRGEVVDGPRNIREFDPEDVSHIVDATDINLKRVFEDLGADATLWYQHVMTLANPFFEGRAPGTRGGDLAAEYIEFYFKEYGLQPAFPASDGSAHDADDDAEDTPGGGTEDAPAEGGGEAAALVSYMQPFDFASPDPRVELLNAEAAINGKPLIKGEDFAVLGVSGSASITAPVTFVGYGIEKGQDDYSSFHDDTDLTGRIALVMRYEPLNDEGKSRWADARFSRHSSVAPKLQAIAKRHAAGIILVNPPGAIDGKSGLESLTSSARFGDRLDVPVVQMSPEAVERLLAASGADALDLLALRKAADAGETRTLNLRDEVQVTLTADLHVDDRLATQNIAAILPGRGDLADQWIVIGAHYDHVGFGYTGAMPNNVGKLHPGADDNASGTAGLLIAAKRLANDYATSPGTENRRSIMFLAFGAEEAGLFGSKWFVKNSSVPADKLYLMLNMDMIGRLRSNNVLVQGTGTAKEFEELLPPLFEASGMTVSRVPGGRGPSDHASFYNAGIPVLFWFTGEHDIYHTPQDRAYTVNPAGAVKIVELVQTIALEFSTREEPLTFAGSQRGAGAGGGGREGREGAAAADGPPATAPAAGGPGGGAGGPGGSRVRLGVMPAYDAELETGVSVESVAEGTSAAEAGIQAGDVMLSWNGEELTGGQKLSAMLAQAAPGDKVKITLQRGEKTLTVDVTLKGRGGG